MIKKISITLAISLSATLFAQAAENNIVTEMTRYVAPTTSLKYPATMVWMPDGNSYLQPSSDYTRIVKIDAATGNELATIFDATHTREASIEAFDHFVLSPDGTKILLRTDSQSIYRHSIKARWFVFEISRNILRPLSTDHPVQMAPTFSGDGLMIAFVADNNIYLKKLVYNSEVAVTTDGATNAIINGAPDWVYEEEFKTTGSMHFSPDNTTLCFLKYNETDVPLYTLPLYDSFCKPDKRYALYPGAFSYKYPVAGEPNSRVTLHSYDIDTRKTKQISFDDSNMEYIPRIAFVPSQPSTLLVSTLNRDQNVLNVYSVNPKSTVAHNILTEKSSTWIDPATYEDMTLENDGFVISSPRSGYSHLYKYTYAGALSAQLTQGDFNVTAYYGTDASTGTIYYQSTSTGSINRVVESLNLRKPAPTILSDRQGTASATFAPGMKFYVMSQSDVSTPTEWTLRTTASPKKPLVRSLVNNADIVGRWPRLSPVEFTTFNVNGVELNAYIIKPADFDENRRYPVIFYQYSGPGSQQVANKWGVDWQQYAALKGYVVVCVDPRGTGAKSREFETIVYGDLGHYETLDLTAVARVVATKPWADPDRFGITGWSYGGYETLMCATDPDTPFKAAVAIAPVTDWRLYDSIYTERYMMTPQENESGYNASAPIKRAAGLSSETLIIYGTSDDNVHPANSIEFVSALQAHDKLCTMLIFPSMNHSINGCNARAQVYAAMMKHFDTTLQR